MRDDGVLALLEVDIRRKCYPGKGETEVIAGLAFALPRGEVTCLVGPSGCGKTTALRIILGLDLSYEGRVSPPAADLRLGVVFQDPRLLPWRTVEENIRLAAPNLNRASLDALLDALALAPWRHHRPGSLSVGMARRAAVARALAVKPELLVLDEAFVSLDEEGADALRAFVFAAARAERVTVLMVTHGIREALKHADVILVLAPRPTRVLRTIRLCTPSKQRDDAWLDAARAQFEDVRNRSA